MYTCNSANHEFLNSELGCLVPLPSWALPLNGQETLELHRGAGWARTAQVCSDDARGVVTVSLLRSLSSYLAPLGIACFMLKNSIHQGAQVAKIRLPDRF